MMRKLLALLLLFVHTGLAQQPQSQTMPVYQINAQIVNGVAPGYWPTPGSGLTLNLSSGTVNCGGAMVSYAGGALPMTSSATNYVYLNTASSCAPGWNLTGFTSTTIPIATVVTNSGAIASIVDDRTPFSIGVGGGGGVNTALSNLANPTSINDSTLTFQLNGGLTASGILTFSAEDVANGLTIGSNAVSVQGCLIVSDQNAAVPYPYVELVEPYDNNNWQVAADDGLGHACGTQGQEGFCIIDTLNAPETIPFVIAGSAITNTMYLNNYGVFVNSITDNALTPSTSPICPNGTGGAFTTSGCSSLSAPAWNTISAPTGNLSLSMGTYTSTFSSVSSTPFDFIFSQTGTQSSGPGIPSPGIQFDTVLYGHTGTDVWSIYSQMPNNVSLPTSVLYFTHSFNSVATADPAQFPALWLTPGTFSTAVAPCSSGSEGMLQAFTDSQTNTFGGTITGGGGYHVMGYCNGTNWVVL